MKKIKANITSYINIRVKHLKRTGAFQDTLSIILSIFLLLLLIILKIALHRINGYIINKIHSLDIIKYIINKMPRFDIMKDIINKAPTTDILISIIYIVLISFSMFQCGRIIYKAFFSEKEKFDSDTLHIFIFYFIIQVVLSSLSGFFCMKLTKYMYLMSFLFIFYAVYFWVTYLLICIKVIKQIKQEQYIFLANSIKSMFGAILIWFSATKIIGSLTFEPDSIYQIINIEVNLSYPLLDMYTYVRSKIDEFDKEEQEKEKYRFDFYNYG